jgi:hypothetical protein
MEEIGESERLKLVSYYLDSMALFWYQNYMRSLGGQEVTCKEYVEALCARFGGQRDPLEELMCNILISKTSSIIKREKHGKNLFFFFFVELIQFTEISIEISVKSLLSWEVPSYQQITCTHSVFIAHTHSNHSKSQTITLQTFKVKFTQSSS